MAFDVNAVTSFVAGLSITGTIPDGTSKTVTIKDLSGVKGQPDERECPILYPDPSRQIVLETLTRDSFGSGSTAKQTIRYFIPYRLLYWPMGGERDLAIVWASLVATAEAIVTAIIQNDNPGGTSVDLYVAEIGIGQTVMDPSENEFHGCDFVFGVVEFVN